ncbi:MAG: hypothetical protein U1E97_09645 [Alphaproteobacteria bacterium]
MSTQTRTCVGVVDGGMLLLDSDEMVVLARVRVPRLGLPGGAVLRMLLQREAQDQPIRIEPVGRDGSGNMIAEAWVASRNLNDYVIQCVRERGYGAD